MGTCKLQRRPIVLGKDSASYNVKISISCLKLKLHGLQSQMFPKFLVWTARSCCFISSSKPMTWHIAWDDSDFLCNAILFMANRKWRFRFNAFHVQIRISQSNQFAVVESLAWLEWRTMDVWGFPGRNLDYQIRVLIFIRSALRIFASTRALKVGTPTGERRKSKRATRWPRRASPSNTGPIKFD